MYIVIGTRDATLDIAIILVVFLIAYIRPCAMARFFNTLVGRFILLAAIVLLSTANTLWGILGVLILVSFRENMTEGMENMDDKKTTRRKLMIRRSPTMSPTMSLMTRRSRKILSLKTGGRRIARQTR